MGCKMNLRDKIIQTMESMPKFDTLNATDEKQYDKTHHEKEVISELKYHIGDTGYSKLFLNQLTQLHGAGYVEINDKKYPYNLTPIYWRLEEIINKKIEFKDFRKKESFLYGKNIFHVHHSQAFYISNNAINYFKRSYPSDESVKEKLTDICINHPDNNSSATFGIDILLTSINSPRKTGEWIIFQNTGNRFHFICLALHNTKEDKNDEQLFNQIKSHLDNSFLF
jgi:hypothetical protein